ncbi:MAG TPA: glycosyltransferase [Candidatus Limnocylindrales bacterium]|nr:glycosyltransferase [Candidatus Limnocylindrales bacterium]
MTANIDLRVSVVIPTFNRAELLKFSVDSVLAALEPGDEVIVVDDGSTDHTEQLVASFGSPVRYLKTENRGAGAARNAGIAAANHDLVAFNDSDDVWLPNHLRLQRQIMAARPDVLFCFSNFGGITAEQEHVHDSLGYWLEEFGYSRTCPWDRLIGAGVPFSSIGQLAQGEADFKVHLGDIYPTELDFNYISVITLLVRRRAAGKALHFPEDLNWGEDWECMARLSRAGLAAYLDCETAEQRVHSGPRLTKADWVNKAALQLKLIERVWGSDAGFMRQNRSRYQAAAARIHLVRARALIVQGSTSEAREELRLAGAAPFSYHALAALPGSLVRGLLNARREVLGWVR